MTELIWDGKYKERKKVGPVCIALPFQTVETVEERKLSAMEPFAFSRSVLEARKSVFNLVPCDNDFEYEFAKFLESAKDVEAFAKLPQQFGFSIEYTDNNANLRYYYPDFVVKTDTGEMWLVETKGQESLEVAFKDRAAKMWCEDDSLKASGAAGGRTFSAPF